MREAKRSFPAGIDYVIPYDSTMFVRTAIEDVVRTLLEAVLLVILVVFIFLQNWRATLIPLLDGSCRDHRHVRFLSAARLLDQHHEHVRSGACDRYCRG